MRDDIEKYVESLDPLNHPPTIAEFMKENRLPPPCFASSFVND